MCYISSVFIFLIDSSLLSDDLLIYIVIIVISYNIHLGVYYIILISIMPPSIAPLPTCNYGIL